MSIRDRIRVWLGLDKTATAADIATLHMLLRKQINVDAGITDALARIEASITRLITIRDVLAAQGERKSTPTDWAGIESQALDQFKEK